MQRRILPKTAIAAKRREIEQIVKISGMIVTHLVRHVLQVSAAASPQGNLHEPANAGHAPEIFNVKQRARHRNHVDIGARCTGDRQHFVDAGVGMFGAVALDSGQTLELNRRLQIIVLEKRGNRVVRAGMNGEDQLWHERLLN